MSEPRIHTGNHEDRTCPGCGDVVRHSEHCGMYGGESRWSPVRHEAGCCGMPCLSAGVRPRDYATGNYHRDAATCAARKESDRG